VHAVVAGADYAKGNRFVHPEARRMPTFRRAGGELFSFFTRLSTGLRVSDSQCGYTALAARAASALPLDELFPRYGYPNDLLGMLAARRFRVVDVPVRPVYADERSGLRPWHAARIPLVIARRWWKERRIERKPS
jgi:dolichol-phosphate mannosyltransferase